MNRMHIHINVKDLEQSIAFYSTLFGAPPVVTKGEYAKWILDDPALNFAISDSANQTGVNHIGIQTDDRDGLSAISKRLKAAGETTFDQEATSCCYAVSDKTWVEDPSGVRWETFFTHGEATVYGDDEAQAALETLKNQQASNVACC
ncbi:MAG: glyoxalase/bleomycin resistance/dioxygenase family protein [Alphaproteobacteria bacterium]|nr:glyoxalase/bleomycin resistance/dioxygenase family protein [Alphaproteobacteria bacterium]